MVLLKAYSGIGMSTEDGTSEVKGLHLEASGKKGKKPHKRKACLGTENENVENVSEMPSSSNEAVPTIIASVEAQPMSPLKKSKKKRKVLKDIEQQIQGSIEKTEDIKQQKSSKRKKRVKFNLESSNMSSDQEKREPVEEGKHNGPILVQGKNRDEELNKPSDTTWVQKASWKSLVGETGRVSFSMGSIMGHNSGALPGGGGESSSTAPFKSSMDGQSSNVVSAWIEGSSSAWSFERSSLSNGCSILPHAKNTSKLVKKSESLSKSEVLNHQHVRTGGVVENGFKKDSQKGESANRALDLKQAGKIEHQDGNEVCRFMRSDNYEQEWLEAKRAVKDIFKRSRKDAVKSMKMFHKKHN